MAIVLKHLRPSRSCTQPHAARIQSSMAVIDVAHNYYPHGIRPKPSKVDKGFQIRRPKLRYSATLSDDDLRSAPKLIRDLHSTRRHGSNVRQRSRSVDFRNVGDPASSKFHRGERYPNMLSLAVRQVRRLCDAGHRFNSIKCRAD